jgi:MarR family transcriptional regulator, lower aerobic nicotinate degradation pathway regulator
MDYKIIRDIVNELERFEQENIAKPFDMKQFGHWLSVQNSNEIELNNKALQATDLLNPSLKVQNDKPETTIGQLLTYLSRYLKLYFKKGLEGTLLTTGDDFSYLAILLNQGSLTKTELIQLSANEKTSGMEVIKRLLNKNLIRQYDDTDDKRSKRITLTNLGREVLFKSFNEMNKVGQICVGDLNEAEKNQLVYLLKKLDNFHNDIYLHHHDKSLEEIMNTKNILSEII